MLRRTVPVLLALGLILAGAGCGINKTPDAGDVPEVASLGDVEGGGTVGPGSVDGDLAAYCELVAGEELAASMSEYIDYYEQLLAVAPEELKDDYEVILANYRGFLEGNSEAAGAPSTDELEAAVQATVEFNLSNC